LCQILVMRRKAVLGMKGGPGLKFKIMEGEGGSKRGNFSKRKSSLL